MMDIDTKVSTIQFTPQEAPHNMELHRMGVHEWVADQCRNMAQEPMPKEQDPPRPWARLPPVCAADTPRKLATAFPTMQPRATGEQVNWFDHLNHPSTSQPYEQDPPLHQQPPAYLRMATGAPGGTPSDPLSSLSSSSLSTIQNPPLHGHPGPSTPGMATLFPTQGLQGSRVLTCSQGPHLQVGDPRGPSHACSHSSSQRSSSSCPTSSSLIQHSDATTGACRTN